MTVIRGAMKPNILILFSFLVTVVAQTYPKCGGSWVQRNDRCYLAVSGSDKEWTDARTNCQNKGGDLVIIPDQATADVLLNMLSGVTQQYWIGLHDKVNEKVFKWVDEETPTDKNYVNWSPGEPNNSGAPWSSEDCVAMKPDTATGKWNDETCTDKRPYICDRLVTSLPKCDESDGWRSYNGKCYQFFTIGARNWKSAQDVCAFFSGGHLAYIKSADDQAFVDNLQITHGTAYWIGLQDGASDGQYQWTDTSPFDKSNSFNKWDTNQPKNNWFGKEGDCGSVNDKGLWTIKNCNTKSNYICEIAEGSCPVGWHLFNGKCYQVNSQVLKTWTDARKFCSAQGAYMTSITSDSENSFLRTYLKDLNNLGIDELYIGISDIGHDGKYTWTVDDKPIGSSGYKHWASGQPPAGVNNQKDCGYILTADYQNAEWIAGDCFMMAAYVCEVPKDTPIKVIPPDQVTDHCADDDYTLFNKKCYKIVLDKKSWNDAHTGCKNENADLISIHDDDVQSFMSARINAVKQRVWMGLNDKAVPDTFVWTDGTPADYDNWAPGHPAAQDCVAMVGWTINYGQWKTRACYETNYFVCEKDAVAGSGPTVPPTQPPVYLDRCGNGWEYDKKSDRCYHFHPYEYYNWYDSRYNCRKEGGDLVSFTGNDDLAYVVGRLKVIANGGISWIGCNDLGTEAGWVWSDRKPFAFINWNPGEPNNVIGDSPTGEHCCEIYNNAGTWNDDYCYTSHDYTCSRDDFIFQYFITFTEKKMQDAVDLTLKNKWPRQCAMRCISETSFSCLSFDYERDARTCYFRSVDKNSGGGLIPTYDSQHFDHYERDKSVPPPVAPTDPPPGMGCPKDWTAYQGSCYYPSFIKKEFADAQTACQNDQADLAAVADLNTNNFLRGMVYDKNQKETRFWIGLNDLDQEMLYKWSNGQPMTFTNWNAYEPNDASGEDCVEMYIDTGFWNDLPCKGYSFNSLCQKPMTTGNPSQPDTTCPQGWIPWYDRCYLLETKEVSWEDAGKNCQKTNGAQLVIIERREELAFLSGQLGLEKRDEFWIGFSDKKVKGLYEWMDGTPITFTNWRRGQPNDNEGNCVTMNSGRNAGYWMDRSCGKKNRYICEAARTGYPPITPPTKVTPTQPTDTDCADGWVGYGSRCFQIFEFTNSDDAVGWDEANRVCHNFGGSLASFHHPDEEMYLVSNFTPTTSRSFWIGLNDQRNEGGYQWSDGTQVEYTNWGPGEPNDYGGEEECVETNMKGGEWNDLFCWYPRNFVCTIAKGKPVITTPVPTPPTGGSCFNDDNWKYFNNYCYFFSFFWTDWYNGEESCHKKDAHLVSIHSNDEQDFVKNRMTFGDYWTGLRSNLSHPGVYKWSDASDLDYEYWLKGQPDTVNGEQLCVKMTGDDASTGRWTDENCGTYARYVCKKPLHDIPVVTHAPTTPPTGGCLDGWKKYPDNRCYKIMGSGDDRDPKLNWQDAKEQCKSVGAFFASIHDAHVQAYITADMMLYANGDVWIGMSALTSDYSFLWTDSSSNDFFNWGYSEPNYYFQGENSTDCVRMKYDDVDPGKWNDEDCSAVHSYLCKMNPDPSNVDKPDTSPCPDAPSDGYTKYGDVCFKVDLTKKTTYEEAKAFCANEGTVLASILSGFEQAKLGTMAMNADDKFWIGLHDDPKTGIFSWIDGWPLYYSNWDWNDPKGLECTAVKTQPGWWTPGGEWKNVECSESYYTACKFNQATPPTPVPTSEGYCEDDWTAFGSSCYIMGSGKFDTGTFKEAVYDCDRYYGGAHVAIIGSKEENAFVMNLAQKDFGLSWILIGLERSPSGAWEWLDGSPVYYTNWGDDEPGSSNCAEIRPDAKGKWYDIGCDINSHFICEKPKLSLVTTQAPIQLQPCPNGGDDGWKWLKPYCYLAVKKYKSWHDSEVWCNQNGGYLASIHSDEEQKFVKEVKSGGLISKFWIGFNKLYDEGSGDDYRWTDGSIPDYTNWDDGQPNDHKGAQKCAQMQRDGTWADTNCGDTQVFVCKRKDDNTSPIIKPSPPPAVGNCPSGWSKIGTGCYQINADTSDYMTWTDARRQCQKQTRGDLASVHDQGTQSLLANMLKTETGNVWIGLAEGTAGWFGFHWVDQSNVDYEHWAKNQPSFNFFDEACVVMVNDPEYPGRWDDIKCDEKHGYLCYQPLNPNLTTMAPPTLPPSGAPSQAPGPCPIRGYLPHDKDCFKIYTDRLTFDDAQKACEDEGAAIATIVDGYTEAFIIANLLYANKETTDSAWIGLVADNSTGLFHWVDKWPVTYTNWSPFEPSGKNQLCVKITQEAEWKTTWCSQTRAYICRTTTEVFVPPTVPVLVPEGCPKDWETFQGQCYNFKTEATNYLSWYEANYLCETENYNSRVLSIHSKAENDFVRQNTESKMTFTGIWLDLTLNETSVGQFEYRWNDGHSVDYTNWNLGEPSSGFTDKNCVIMMPNAYGKWVSTDCSWGASYICQKPQETRSSGAQTGISGGSIAAIIIGILLAVILVIILGYFLMKNRQSKRPLEEPGLPPTTGFDNVLYTPSLEEIKTPQIAINDAKTNTMSEA